MNEKNVMIKKLKRQVKGITLIALVVTIIVLLILAAVAINLTIGDNGIITRAQDAKKIYDEASEREAIEMAIVEKFLDKNYNLGIKLYDKNLSNGNSWNIIKELDNEKIYGTGYSYLKKGTKIENVGTLNYNWIINDLTGEIIKLEDDKFTYLTSESGIGVLDNLIFNMDSSIIDKTNEDDLQDNIKEILGENVELINFDWNEESGLTRTSFNLDGVDDYIKVKYDSEEEKNKLIDNGFTFEFYGILNPGTSYDNGTIINDSIKGIFCYWNENESKQAQMRFGIRDKDKIEWNTGWGQNYNDFGELSAGWNLQYQLDDEIYGNEIYFSVTLDPTQVIVEDGEEYIRQTLYINGQKTKYDGKYNKKNWEVFKKEMENLNTFCIGRTTWGADEKWHYIKMNAYSLRLYNKALSEEEIKLNYDTSVPYHELLEEN